MERAAGRLLSPFFANTAKEKIKMNNNEMVVFTDLLRFVRRYL